MKKTTMSLTEAFKALNEDAMADTLDALIADEQEAIDGYEKAQEDIQTDSNYDPDAIGEIYSKLDHIKKEEQEHIEELVELKNDYTPEEDEDLDEELEQLDEGCEFFEELYLGEGSPDYLGDEDED